MPNSNSPDEDHDQPGEVPPPTPPKPEILEDGDKPPVGDPAPGGPPKSA